MFASKIRKSVALAVGLATVALSALVLAPIASASSGAIFNVSYSGWVGPYNPQYAFCSPDNGTVAAGLPQVAAVNDRATSESQWVRFRAYLYRVDPSTGAVTLTADRYGNSSLEQWAWATDASILGAPWNTNFTSVTFFPRYHGTYRIVTVVDWMTSATVPYSGTAMALLNMAYLGGPNCNL